MRHFYGDDTRWGFGIVEDVLDPTMAGRVRVRVYGLHSVDASKLPTSDLPWSMTALPTTEAATSGLGASPTGLVRGSLVYGIFTDGEDKQNFLVLGAIVGGDRPTTVQGVVQSDLNGALYGVSNSEALYNQLIGRGMSAEEAAGAVGAIAFYINDSTLTNVDVVIDNRYGMGRWDDEGKARLREYASDRNLASEGFIAQALFLTNSLVAWPNRTGSGINDRALTVEGHADSFAAQVMGINPETGKDQRHQFARHAYAQYGPGGGSTGDFPAPADPIESQPGQLVTSEEDLTSYVNQVNRRISEVVVTHTDTPEGITRPDGWEDTCHLMIAPDGNILVGTSLDQPVPNLPAGTTETQGGTLRNPSLMSISDEGKDFIKAREGFGATAYPDASGYSIGYGHFIQEDESHLLTATLTREDADALFDEDIIVYERPIRSGITTNLAQSQYDALVSLVYNIGGGAFSSSTLRRELNAGNYNVREFFERFRFVRVDGEPRENAGLLSRRRQEAQLFERGNVPLTGATLRNHRELSIAVSFVGGITASGDKSPAAFTQAQYRSFRTLVSAFLSRWPHASFVGMRDLDSTSNSPLFDVRAFVQNQAPNSTSNTIPAPATVPATSGAAASSTPTGGEAAVSVVAEDATTSATTGQSSPVQEPNVPALSDEMTISPVDLADDLLEAASDIIPSLNIPSLPTSIPSPFSDPIVNIAGTAAALGIDLGNILDNVPDATSIQSQITSSLTDYYSGAEIDGLIGDFITGADVTSELASYVKYTDSIGDLSDITLTSPSNGQYLRWTGASFVNATISYADITGTPGSGDFVDLTSNQTIEGVKDFTGTLRFNGNDVLVASALDDYLPLTGGTVTGATTISALTVTNSIEAYDSINLRRSGAGYVRHRVAGQGLYLGVTSSGGTLSYPVILDAVNDRVLIKNMAATDETNEPGDITKVRGIHFGWDSNYGTQKNHGIFSANTSGTYTDDILINSYGDVAITIDSNNNDALSAKFSILRNASSFGGTPEEILKLTQSGVLTVDGSLVWTAGNDGSGSGLDADLLDGIQSNRFLYGANESGATTLSNTQNLLETQQWKAGFWDVFNSASMPDTNWYWGATFAHTSNRSTYHYSGQIAFRNGQGGNHVYLRTVQGGATPSASAWSRIWTDTNDGSGSGLDADLLDGQHGSYYASAASLGSYLPLTGGSLSGYLQISKTSGQPYLDIVRSGTLGTDYPEIRLRQAGRYDRIRNTGSGLEFCFNYSATEKIMRWTGTSLTLDGSAVWTAGNDGSGSGLDADLLDGLQGSQFLRSDASDTTTGTITINRDGTMLTLINSAARPMSIAAADPSDPNSPFVFATSNAFDFTVDGASALTISSSGAVLAGGSQVWTAGNDGSGSGLDADLLDGQQGSYYASAASLGSYLPLTGGTLNGILSLAAQGVEGGEMHFVQGTNSTSLSGSTVVLDLTGGMMRLYENGGSFRMFNFNIDTGAIVHSSAGTFATQAWANSQFSLTGHTHSYLPLSGGTVSGTLNVGGTAYRNYASGETDITGLVPGSTFGTLIEGVGNAHVVIGIRANDTNDGFHVICDTNNDGTYTSSLMKLTQNAFTAFGSTVWTAGNDGSGSGLDADLLDGQHGSYYASAASLGSYLPLTGGTVTGALTVNGGVSLDNAGSGDAHRLVSYNDGGTGTLIISRSNSSWNDSFRLVGGLAQIYANSAAATWNGTTFTAANFSGNGSALTALNGSNITSGTIADARIHSNLVRYSDVFASSVDWDAQSDFVVRDSNDAMTNFIWRDKSAGLLYLGTPTAAVTFRSSVNLNGNTISNGTFAGDFLTTGKVGHKGLHWKPDSSNNASNRFLVLRDLAPFNTNNSTSTGTIAIKLGVLDDQSTFINGKIIITRNYSQAVEVTFGGYQRNDNSFSNGWAKSSDTSVVSKVRFATKDGYCWVLLSNAATETASTWTSYIGCSIEYLKLGWTGASVDSDPIQDPANYTCEQITSETGFTLRSTPTLANDNDIWTSGNDGSGSGLDADLLDGYHASAHNVFAANSVVTRNGSGYIFTGFLNTTANTITGGETKMAVQTGDSYLRWMTPASFMSNQGIWTSGNDGAGSGLDADLLDGLQGSAYALLTGATFTGPVIIPNQGTTIAGTTWSNGWFRIGTSGAGWTFDSNEMFNSGAAIIGTLAGDIVLNPATSLSVNASGFTWNGGTIWTSGNDGSGSGLDADLLDGQNLSSSDTASTVVGRDGSGDIQCRLVRSNYGTTSTSPAAGAGVAFRNASGTGTDNYIRTCTRTAFAGYLAGEAFTWTASQTFNDNVRVRLGTGNDTQIWHNGSNTYIDHYTGNIYIRDNTTVRFTFERTTGNFTATGNVTASSDARLKNLIGEFDGSRLLDNLKVYAYNWKDGRGESVGPTTQEIRAAGGDVFVVEGEDGYDSLDYGKYSVALVSELKKKNEALEDRIEKLEALVETLISQI